MIEKKLKTIFLNYLNILQKESLYFKNTVKILQKY